MKLFIKNMVCNRCIMVVKNELEKLGYHVNTMELGEAGIAEEVDAEGKNRIDTALQKYGFSLIDDKKSRIIERIKNLIVDLVHDKNSELRVNLSDYLSNELNLDYPYISNLFSQVEGTTIEKYYIAQKIERVKEWLVYDELSLSEIAFRLHYSSVAHLSSQFKKVTGLTPAYFKKMGVLKRKSLDHI